MSDARVLRVKGGHWRKSDQASGRHGRHGRQTPGPGRAAATAHRDGTAQYQSTRTQTQTCGLFLSQGEGWMADRMGASGWKATMSEGMAWERGKQMQELQQTTSGMPFGRGPYLQ